MTRVKIDRGELYYMNRDEGKTCFRCGTNVKWVFRKEDYMRYYCPYCCVFIEQNVCEEK